MDTLKQRVDELSPAKRRLIALRREKTGSQQAAIVRVPRKHELPLSFAQQRQWLLHQFAPESPLYNAPEVLRIRGRLDVQILERSLNEIVRRHEVLRTVYRISDNQPVQAIQPKLQITLRVSDIRDLSYAEREAAAMRSAQEEIQRPLDLAHGPVLRALLVKLQAEDHLLAITFHHIAYDGWSKTIFNQELAAIYDAFLKGSPSPLPELPVQYADYAVWQRNFMQGEILRECLGFWRSQLRGAPASVALPTDHAPPRTTNFEGAHEVVLLAANVVEDLKILSKQQGTTLFISLLSVFEVLLAHWSQQNDVVVGTVVANRGHLETENLIGCFTNFLPLRSRIAETDTALELLQKTNKTVLQAYARQDCPFEKIVEDLNPERAASATPLYNVVFLLQNYPEIAFESRNLQVEAVPVEREAAHMELRIAAREVAQGLRIACNYRRDLFRRGTIQALLNNYCALAQQFASNPYASLSQFRLSGELLEQAARARERARKQNLVVTSTFTAEAVEEPLRFWMNELEIPCEVRFAPFNQVFQSLLDPNSELSHNQCGLNVVLVRFEDWCTAQSQDGEALPRCLERNVEELITSLRQAAARSAVPYLLCICPPWHEVLASRESRELFHHLERRVADSLNGENAIYVVTSADLIALYPVANYEDREAYELGRLPYTQDFFNALGTMIARRFYRIHTPPHKAIVLDCDNTLWRGICGEDGPGDVQVDAACRSLQRFVMAQREAGMLIVLCSKNNEADVWNVFAQNQDMALGREHIAGYRINWQSKSENLRSLAAELNLGLDSFIFLDDDAMECAEVESGCPEVLVLQLPQNEAELTALLSHVWAFDHLKVTREDRLRSEFYAQNAQREQLERQSINLEEFLAGLELQVDIRPMEKADVARVSQLTQRTNQFNFTTLRRTEGEIDRLCASGVECLVVTVRDRFGDYGLVGVMIFRSHERVLELDSLLLSCRALGRRVEHRMLAHFGQVAAARGMKRLRIRFAPTPRNEPARAFLNSLRATFERDGKEDSLYWETTPETLQALRPGAPAITTVQELRAAVDNTVNQYEAKTL